MDNNPNPDDSSDSHIFELEKIVAVLEERLRCGIEARDLQAKEYERRLQELNHAHRDQVERNANYVSRDNWEARNMEMEKWRREIDRWRWIAIGAGIAGGGLAGMLAKLILR